MEEAIHQNVFEKYVCNKKNLVIEWIKDPYNLGLVLIVLFAVLLRLYLNDLGQPLWWDEAEYMLQAKHLAFGTPNSGWNIVRPVLFPMICSFFYRIGFGESFFRFFIIGFSSLGIVVTYLIGKRLFNAKTGIIAGFLVSVFYLDLFMSGRLLIDMPSLSLGMLGVFLFWNGYIERMGSKWLIWSGIVLGVGIMFRYTIGLFVILILAYLIVTEKLGFLKNKRLWITALAGFVVMLPYFIWSTLKYGNPVHRMWVSLPGVEYSGGNQGLGQFLMYLKVLPGQLGTVFLVVFIIALALFLFKLIIGFDLFLKGKEKVLNRQFFLFLWVLIPLMYFGFSFWIFEPRYVLYSFPPIFLFGAGFLSGLSDKVKANQKIIVVLIVVILIVFSGYSQFKMGKSLIDSKKDSYLELKQVGLWLKENTEKDVIVLNNGVPQNTYYSERETSTVGTDYEEEFLDEMRERKPDYLVLSIWERSQPWLYSYPQNHPEMLKPVMVFGREGEQMPRAVIYKFEENF
ncbi:MAG: glycosyltransferase family 39 protein [Nanoarchaeota archaeon]|nr:glycosyltransferase family 39 protein [Nanoarchaeota archaeon]